MTGIEQAGRLICGLMKVCGLDEVLKATGMACLIVFRLVLLVASIGLAFVPGLLELGEFEPFVPLK
jgi:hypothetical protein